MDIKKVQTLWAHLHCLSVLQQQGSFTATAKRLGISKAAVSQRISELEKACGLPLVRRTTRSVQLTEAGYRLAENTRQEFESIAHQFATVQELATHPRGWLRITAPLAFSRQQLIPKLQGFMNRYPDVQVDLNLSDQLLSLEQEAVDLAIRHTSTPPDTHVAWELCQTTSLLVASPEYLAKHGVPEHPDQLVQHRCLHYPRSQRTATWTFEQHSTLPAQRLTVPISGAFVANNSEALRDIALQHQGIALVPDFSVQEALQKGSLVQVLPDWQPSGAFGDYVYALRPYSAQVPLTVRLFVEYLRDVFKQGFKPHT